MMRQQNIENIQNALYVEPFDSSFCILRIILFYVRIKNLTDINVNIKSKKNKLLLNLY